MWQAWMTIAGNYGLELAFIVVAAVGLWQEWRSRTKRGE